CDRLCLSCTCRMALEELVLRRSRPDVVIAISNASAEEHRRLRWAHDRTRVIPHAFPSVTPREPRPRHAVTFGYIGRLVPEKGVRTLLNALRLSGLEDAHLRLAGDGPLRSEIEASESAGRVHLLGWVDGERKDAFFRSIDCLVVPSELREPAALVV